MVENKKIQKVILDTDMGVDCDDAVALAILLNKHIKGEIDLLCVTASSTREGATGTIQAIAEYYGVTLKIGAMAQPGIPCDKINNYSKALMEKYNTKDVSTDAVTLIRQTLANSTEKVTFIAVGPLTNLARLLRSEADEISPLNGRELLLEKVETVYCMGGGFEQNRVLCGEDKALANATGKPEWNILQDIESAKFVTQNSPVGLVFAPFEVGFMVRTKMQKGDNPVWFAMLSYAISERYAYEPSFERMSWDPVTCLCATEDVSAYYNFSCLGKVKVNDNGITIFEEGKGEDRIVLLKEGYLKIANLINSMVDPVKE